MPTISFSRPIRRSDKVFCRSWTMETGVRSWPQYATARTMAGIKGSRTGVIVGSSRTWARKLSACDLP